MTRPAAARTRPRSTLRPRSFGLLVAVAAIVGTQVFQTRVGGAVTEADGALPDGMTVVDDQYPGLANLDPDLLRALRTATTDAAHDGITLYVNSGWRSP